MAVDCFDMTMAELLEQSASEPAPGAGAAAAVTIALAASLVTKIARRSESWPDGPGVAAQAVELLDRCPALAQEDTEAWQSASTALAGSGPAVGDAELAILLDRAATLPLAIAETGADVAGLALVAAEWGDADFRAEAVAAALLAHAGARIAAHLVAINLGTRPDDERIVAARRVEQAAAAAATAAAAAGE